MEWAAYRLIAMPSCSKKNRKKLMIDHLPTLLAHFVTYWLPGPRVLLVRAWAWLCAETDNLDKKRRCLCQVS